MRIIPVIVGPTGSGKTGVGIEVAKAIEQKFGKRAEIISADSRTIYRGFDVGTAKPTIRPMCIVSLWGLAPQQILKPNCCLAGIVYRKLRISTLT